MHACIWKLDASHFRWQSYALGARCTVLGAQCSVHNARCNHTRTPVRAACTVVAWLSHDYTDHPVSHWTNTVPKEKLYFFTMMQHRLSHVDIPVGKKTPKHGAWESSLEMITLVLKLIKSPPCVTFILCDAVWRRGSTSFGGLGCWNAWQGS